MINVVKLELQVFENIIHFYSLNDIPILFDLAMKTKFDI